MFSVVICSISQPKFQAVAGQWQRAMERAGEPWEIVGVGDAKSLCDGYRRGLAASHGEIVVFSHDDIELWSDDFVQRLKHHLATYDVVGVAGTTRLVGANWFESGPPYSVGQVAHYHSNEPCGLMLYGGIRRVVGGIQALDGLLLAFRRPVIEHIGWDAETFTGFHMYDLDATYRAHRAGYKLAVALDLLVCHFSGGSYDARWAQYAQAFLQKHGATLERLPKRRVTPMGVHMNSKEEIRNVMVTIAQSLPE
jgi:hypothetical protein